MKIETKDVVDIGDEVFVKVCEVDPEAGSKIIITFPGSKNIIIFQGEQRRQGARACQCVLGSSMHVSVCLCVSVSLCLCVLG